MYGALGVPLLLGLLAGGNLLSYSRLAQEQPVGSIAFRRLDNGHYLATLATAAGRRHFELDGDSWRLDARVIKWKPWANLLGLDALYRLERLEGRYSDPQRARRVAPVVYSLSPPALLDLWELAQRHAAWLPALDAAYGSSVYLPMGEGLTYRIRMTQSGLLARAGNPDEANTEPH